MPRRRKTDLIFDNPQIWFSLWCVQVRLFVKTYYPWCHKAQQWLDAHGIKYDLLDVLADSRTMAEMVNLSSQQYVTVIEVDGKVLADFGPEELEEFWKKI